MVICDRPVAEVCPVEWGRMANRSVLQWDKDDCAAIGLVKFDLLGLGMLSALHYAVDLVAEHEQKAGGLRHARPGGAGGLRDAAAGRLGRGVPGRVEGADGHSAAATAADVLRPGRGGGADPARPDPGQLGAPVHPAAQRVGAGHLRPSGDGTVAGQDPGHPAVPGTTDATGGRRGRVRRRRGRPTAPGDGGQAVDRSDGEAQEPGCTTGWPGCTGSPERPPTGSTSGLLAFANFGFAESHAFSFAALVFYSSWLKLYHPAAFCAALLRAQPMGFYSPQSLVADARRHGVTVRRPDINRSMAQARSRTRPGQHTGQARPGGPTRAGRYPHHRRRSGRAARRRPTAGRLPHARRADPGGHPDHRAGRGVGDGGGVGRADQHLDHRDRSPPGVVGGRGGGRVEGGHPARQRGRSRTHRRCPA